MQIIIRYFIIEAFYYYYYHTLNFYIALHYIFILYYLKQSTFTVGVQILHLHYNGLFKILYSYITLNDSGGEKVDYIPLDFQILTHEIPLSKGVKKINK